MKATESLNFTQIIANYQPVIIFWTLVVQAAVRTSFDNGNNYAHVQGR